MKKQVLFVYGKMIVGGSTTSLLSLLNEIDYSQYDVDLLLFEKGGSLDEQIPSKVNIIENHFLQTYKRNLTYIIVFILTYIKSLIKQNSLIRSQIMSRELAKRQPELGKEYDRAIAYLEFWPSNYVHQKVNAKRKILWLHCDYKGTHLNPKYDRVMYESADTVVTVSKACEDNFKELFPSVNSVVTIHNILSSKTIHGLSYEYEPPKKLYNSTFVFVTVARIDFTSKGHDRGVAVFQKIKELHPKKNFKWLIIGDGPDRKRLEELIISAGLHREITLLGERMNPHPYVRRADIFFMPSRYEGKPMAVTEAQMNGCIPFVTNYASAHGQIYHLHDGLICENDDNAIFEMMNQIFSEKINLVSIKKEISNTNYSNREEVVQLYKLLNELKD